ncbi:hypothetical protein [Halegenticoccus soli]|uniref:hypothetical protein n=1 Tax=Halegenticoccus soli TaxID=1985678 RepID=UPI000C6DC620|nr:hypothetical protein [Halegenticoccus soli]
MQRSDQRERESVAFDDEAAGAGDDERGGQLSGLARRTGSLFSIKVFLAALAASLVGLLLGGSIPIVGFLGRIAGLFVVAFVVGLASRRRRYVEVGLAAALASGLVLVLTTLGTFGTVAFPFAVRAFSQYGTAIAGVGAGTGLLVALVGHYFGRDLRAGLTREVS